jgi:hypothetical protein
MPLRRLALAHEHTTTLARLAVTESEGAQNRRTSFFTDAGSLLGSLTRTMTRLKRALSAFSGVS